MEDVSYSLNQIDSQTYSQTCFAR